MSATRLDVPVDGGALAAFWIEPERPDPVPVLAIHGITSSSRSWLAVSRAAREPSPGPAMSLLAVDLRGRGASHALPPPYGLAAHVGDMVAVLDHIQIDRAVILGHSLGAYIAARFAAEHPERVGAVVLVDGGLRIPGSEGADPQSFLDAFLGPALARLRMRFAGFGDHRDWWRAHPALRNSDVEDADLEAYADYDLVGEPPELRSSVAEEAVRADAADLFQSGENARRLTLPATLLCAPRGLIDDPNPMQPLPLCREWASAAPDLREARQVPDVNHYTIVFGRRGAHSVVEAIRASLAR